MSRCWRPFFEGCCIVLKRANSLPLLVLMNWFAATHPVLSQKSEPKHAFPFFWRKIHRLQLRHQQRWFGTAGAHAPRRRGQDWAAYHEQIFSAGAVSQVLLLGHVQCNLCYTFCVIFIILYNSVLILHISSHCSWLSKWTTTLLVCQEFWLKGRVGGCSHGSSTQGPQQLLEVQGACKRMTYLSNHGHVVCILFVELFPTLARPKTNCGQLHMKLVRRRLRIPLWCYWLLRAVAMSCCFMLLER